jgi:hypothetical protein
VIIYFWSQEESFYKSGRASSVVLFDQLRSMHLCCGFPGVVTLGVSLPFEEVLQLLLSPKVAVVSYRLHFVFIFSYCNVGRWSGEVRTMVICLDIWG